MDYKVRIAKGLYWVPAEKLGRCRYSREALKKAALLPIDVFPSMVENLEEAIRIFDILNYHEKEDAVVVEEQGLLWEFHPPLSGFVEAKGGSCASAASWLTYVLHGKYEMIAPFLIFRENETGHVINIIKNKGFYYFVDLYQHLAEYQNYVCPETGLLSDFARQKYITSIVYMAEEMECFTNFYSRAMKNHVSEHLYFVFHPGIVPPIASEKTGNEVIIYIPRTKVVHMIPHSSHMVWNGNICPEYKIRIG